MWLAVIAVAGDMALTATLVFPVAVTIIVGVTLVPQLFWPGVAGIIFFAWLLRPGYRFQGRELKEDAPQLRRDIEALKQKLRVPGRMRVYLDDSFNAAAMQTRGFLGLLGTRCGLILGVPLLGALGREQVLAIIAHEFGHFSRRHGLLGQWLYRARVGWMEYARQVGDSDSVLDRAAAWYARKFVPVFSALTFAESRQCEYEADSDAALAVGGRPFAEALTRAVVVGRYWEKELLRQLNAWQLELPEPPNDFLQRFAHRTRQLDSANLESRLKEEMRAPSSSLDTHPSLSDRLQALQQQPAVASPADVAGEVLLGAAWPKVVAEFNDKWAREQAPSWLAQHLRLKHVVKPLLDADERTARSWSVELRLARTLALWRVDAAAGVPALRELHELAPEHRRIRFAYAAALLAEGEESGVERMEALARENPAFRVEALKRVLAYFERKADTRQIERWSPWLARASQSLEEAKSAVVLQAERGQAQASSLAARERALIADAARLDPCVVCAWLLEGSAAFRYSPDREPLAVVTHLLALVVDPEEARKRAQDEETVARRYAALLREVLPPDEACAVRTFFTTEGRPAVYKPNCELALYATDDARLSLSEGLGKNDWV
jgi:Zn-dependent protease with chaperone function